MKMELNMLQDKKKFYSTQGIQNSHRVRLNIDPSTVRATNGISNI